MIDYNLWIKPEAAALKSLIVVPSWDDYRANELENASRYARAKGFHQLYELEIKPRSWPPNPSDWPPSQINERQHSLEDVQGIDLGTPSRLPLGCGPITYLYSDNFEIMFVFFDPEFHFLCGTSESICEITKLSLADIWARFYKLQKPQDFFIISAETERPKLIENLEDIVKREPNLLEFIGKVSKYEVLSRDENGHYYEWPHSSNRHPAT